MKSMTPFLLILPLLLVPRTVFSTTADTLTAESSALTTVLDLMRLDSELALAAARQRTVQGKTAGLNAGRSHDTVESPQLVGIYGVGKRLFAEVRSGSQALLFLKGHSLPVGHVGGHELYRLKDLDGACVRLERQGNETVLCLPRAGRQ